MKGFKWVLGDGERVRVLEDQWVRGKEDLRIDNVQDPSLCGRKVSDFFIPGELMGCF